MAMTRIVITLDQETLSRLDHLVQEKAYPSRSKAIREAIQEKVEHARRNRLAVECAKLDPNSEQALAEEGMGTELATWPQY